MIRTLTFRLTWQFAVLVTLTTMAVLVAGGWVLRHQAVRGLQAMHRLEGEELVKLITEEPGLTIDAIRHRLQQDSDSDAALYLVQVRDARGRVLFRSPNLGDSIMPAITGPERHVTTHIAGIGDVRVSEFSAGSRTVQVASPLTPINRLLAEYAKVSGVLVIVVALASVGLGYAFSRITLRPVRVIEGTARRIGADNLRERIPMPGTRDELAGLAALLNEMFDRLEGSFEQVRRFTADASHELKTPLALVRLNAERLRTRVANDPEASAGLADLLEEIGRMNRIIESLLFIAKAESGALSLSLGEHDVRTLLAPFVEDARVLAEDSGVFFDVVRNEAGAARLEPALLRQLLLNVVGNALKVSPAGARVVLESVRTESGWRFIITDEGPGLPAEQLEKVFERFVRFEQNAEVTRGHGLGLAICRSIAELHHGTIHAENRTDGRSGLRVMVELPR
jgi:signal transduction histidine kinase